MKQKITELYPWTLSTALDATGIPHHLRSVYAEFCPAAQHESENGRKRWAENPIPNKLWCAVYRRFNGDSQIEVMPLGHLTGWDIAYTGTKPMAEQARRQFVRQFPELPHKDPVSAFQFNAHEASVRIRVHESKIASGLIEKPAGEVALIP